MRCAANRVANAPGFTIYVFAGLSLIAAARKSFWFLDRNFIDDNGSGLGWR
ncbi:hypothetical protein MnTg02_01712 [bacterium MnTg02]|nr:hypothetical protein MnTg02_01712 [bacterium MnTg02]